MIQGMLIKQVAGHFSVEDNVLLGEDERIALFDEDEQEWLEGTVKKDTFGEYFFTDGFQVVYLYEGLPVRIKN